VLGNSERVLAIELLAGAQGVEFLAPLEPGAGGRAAHDWVRSVSPRVREDRSLAAEIERVATAVRDGSALAAVEADVGELT
jgi:histidine ammonia-lyase